MRPPFKISSTEQRTIMTSEMRTNVEDKRLYGYTAVFNEYSENMGGWFEIIEPGAFDDVLSDDVRMTSR